MQSLLFTTIFFILLTGFRAGDDSGNPLTAFDPSWSAKQFEVCNTARNVSYLNSTEKEVIYILNLIRKNPAIFRQTVLQKWPEKGNRAYLRTNSYYLSLMEDLKNMKPVGLLTADSLAWVSALCHAQSNGDKGLTGHNRKSEECESKQFFHGECIQYGYEDALEIVLDLLIDEGIKNLGHRKICLDGGFHKLGVSIEPHKTYRDITVLDFLR